MTKYAKLKDTKDNFIRAAAKAKSTFMIALWTERARKVQEKIDAMTVEEASEEIGE